MALLIIEHMVGDYETFKEVFLDDQERRRRLGIEERSRPPQRR